MNADNNAILRRIRGEIEKIEDGINLLDDVSAFNYVYALLSEKIFTIPRPEIQDKSAYLAGAYDAMQELSALPKKINEVLNQPQLLPDYLEE